jgi:hypothetical protein
MKGFAAQKLGIETRKSLSIISNQSKKVQQGERNAYASHASHASHAFFLRKSFFF